MKRQILLTVLCVLAAVAPLSAGSGYYWELADPLFAYCEKLKASSLLQEESSSFFEQCVRAQNERDAVEAQEMKPSAYLASLRQLDQGREKSLWQLHLLLRSAITNDDVGLFERIAAFEERRPFEMNGLLPHALAFMKAHKIEVPYYINPDAVQSGPFQYVWNPDDSGAGANQPTER